MNRKHDFGALSVVRTLLAVAVGVAAFTACGKTTPEGGSGETHFLASCDGECPEGLTCLCGVCTRECTTNDVCDALGATCHSTCPSSANVCDVLCQSAGDCAAVSASHVCVQGQCRAPNPDVNDDFAACAGPPDTTCTREAFCEIHDCGGLDYDEDGCKRAPCEADAVCGDDERCTAVQCGDRSTCTPSSDGTCECVSDASCMLGSACVPVSVVGQRGDWVSLEVTTTVGPCPEGGCGSSYTFGPDGGLAFTKEGLPGTSALDAFALDELRRIIDGAFLRPALAEGIPCDPIPPSISVSMRLVLTTGTFERDVTGCAVTGPEGNVFEQVFQFAQRY